MMSSPPQTGSGIIIFSGLFGLLNIVAFWWCYDRYTTYHIKWKTGSDDRGLFRITLMVTLMIFANCMVILCAHLPKVDEMQKTPSSCVLFDDESQTAKGPE